MSLKFLPVDFDFNQIEIYKKALEANNALAELNNSISLIPNFELLLQPLTAREAVASSEIENIRTTTLELLQAELMTPTELNPAQKETLNYKNALLQGFDYINEYKHLNIAQILDIQAQIVPEKSGARTRSVFVGNRLGETIYRPPESEILQEYLENLESYFNTQNNLDVLINMAITHYQFESIHPFLDGNGRTGRILMVLYLVLKNRLNYPVLFLSGYILKYKAYYYQLFNEVREQNNWIDWVVFMLNGVEIQAKETMAKINEIKQLETKVSQIIKSNFNRMEPKHLSNYFFSKAFYTQGNLSKSLNISRPTATKYLEKMQDLGIFETRKANREKLYFIPEFLEILG